MWLTVDDFKILWLSYLRQRYGTGGGFMPYGPVLIERSPFGWCQKPAQDTLRMFDQDPKTDPKVTPYYKASVMMVSKKMWWHGAKTPEDCVKRTLYLVSLRRSIEREGIREPITLKIENDGKMVVQDGYHRLFCADYIGYKKEIPVKVGDVGSDFKAMERLLLKLGKGKRYTYHPLYDSSSALYHPYFRNWKAWRVDTPYRYKGILAKLGGVKTVLDIGPCEGYFSINIAARGHDVTAVELHPERAKVLKFFANLRGVQIPVAVEDWRGYCARTDKEFDAILLLGTFHHQLRISGTGEWKKLELLKTKKLFFEMATNKDPRMGKFPTLTNSEIVRKVLENTQFTRWEKAYGSQHPWRSPGFMFT